MAAVNDHYRRLLFEVAEARRVASTATRAGTIYEEQTQNGDQKVRVIIGTQPDGTPWITPWLNTANMWGGARERRFFKKGQNAVIHLGPGGDFRQGHVSHGSPNTQFKTPDHAQDAGPESETYQLGGLRVTKKDGIYDIWLAQDNQGSGTSTSGLAQSVGGLSSLSGLVGSLANTVSTMISGGGVNSASLLGNMQSVVGSISSLTTSLPQSVLGSNVGASSVVSLMQSAQADLTTTLSQLPQALPDLSGTAAATVQTTQLMNAIFAIMHALSTATGAVASNLDSIAGSLSVLDPNQVATFTGQSAPAVPSDTSLMNELVTSVASGASSVAKLIDVLNGGTEQMIQGAVAVISDSASAVGYGVINTTSSISSIVNHLSSLTSLSSTNVMTLLEGAVGGPAGAISAISSLLSSIGNLASMMPNMSSVLSSLGGGQLASVAGLLGGAQSMMSGIVSQLGIVGSQLSQMPTAANANSANGGFGPAQMKIRINKNGGVTGRVGAIRFAAHSTGSKIKADKQYYVALPDKLILSSPPIIDKDPVPDDDI